MIRPKLNEALKNAMKAKDDIAVRTLRLILAALKDRDIAARTRGKTDGVEDDEILALLQTMVKQRRESIQLYEQGGRLDLAEQEAAEIAVIQGFLPQQMDEAETRAAVEGLIAETGATGIKDMGRVMADLRARYAGRMDFAKASGMVKAALG
ncbi:MAG TPA: GatB/YqeY domain-containing protein [Alphaproteobacteria bacterium]|nr:GatB/YqeY domain-containing protein [Alphaproteobacteria bacterium]